MTATPINVVDNSPPRSCCDYLPSRRIPAGTPPSAALAQGRRKRIETPSRSRQVVDDSQQNFSCLEFVGKLIRWRRGTCIIGETTKQAPKKVEKVQ
ncbi:hypothetical protein Trydic_g19621 [Trypoxylus dichotomus]